MMKSLVDFLVETFCDFRLIYRLAKNDFKARYAGSFLGIIWAFLQPTVTIMVFWFVFEVGFKSMPVQNVPFILWFVPGYIPWLFFSESISTTSNSLYEYSYLIKKVKFKTSVLPIIKIISTMVIHVFFMLFTLLMYAAYDIPFNPILFQAGYYFIALLILLIGCGWICASISVFLKDFPQIVGIVLQVGFWATPVFWNPIGMNPRVMFLLKLNPVYYIVAGYRDTFVYGIPFWNYPWLTIYFWTVTASIFLVGALMFRRLQHHFADVI